MRTNQQADTPAMDAQSQASLHAGDSARARQFAAADARSAQVSPRCRQGRQDPP